MVHRIPLRKIKCISDKTYKRLEEEFGGLALGLARQKKSPKKNRFYFEKGCCSRIKDEAGEVNDWRYEPSAAVPLYELRLGEEGGEQGWYRLWQWWRQHQEINEWSLKKFKEIAG